jgi:hypothetical protein
VNLSNKNKRFNYKPRYQKETVEPLKEDFRSKWEELKPTNKRRSSIFTSPIFLVLFLISVIVLMYVLGRYE